MATTPLASKTDVEQRLRRELTVEEAGLDDRWINGFLDEASARVVAYCGRTFDEELEIPAVVRLVTSRVAARGVTTAPTAEGLGDQKPIVVGPVQWAAPSPEALAGGGWLTQADRQMLKPWVVGGRVTSVYTG